MPNYCDSDLRVTGKYADVEAFLEFVGMNREENPTLDFNTIIPYPKEYDELDNKAKVARANGDYSFKDGYNSGGYDWCINNWGTKWNAGSTGMHVDKRLVNDRRSVVLSFETAWSPCNPVIKALGEKFPELTLSLRYYEMGMGFKGTFQMKKGIVVKDVSSKYTGKRGG